MSDKRKSVLPFIRDILDSIEKIEKLQGGRVYTLDKKTTVKEGGGSPRLTS